VITHEQSSCSHDWIIHVGILADKAEDCSKYQNAFWKEVGSMAELMLFPGENGQRTPARLRAHPRAKGAKGAKGEKD
jgi:hypothetical protein